MRASVLLSILLLSTLLLVFIRALWVKPELHPARIPAEHEDAVAGAGAADRAATRVAQPWLELSGQGAKEARQKAAHPQIAAAFGGGLGPPQSGVRWRSMRKTSRTSCPECSRSRVSRPG